MSDRFLRISRACRILSCSRSHVYSLIRTGKIHAVRLDGEHGLRIAESEIERFMNSRLNI